MGRGLSPKARECWSKLFDGRPKIAVGSRILRICDLLRKPSNIIIPVLRDGGGDSKGEGPGLQLLANNNGNGVRYKFEKPIKIVK